MKNKKIVENTSNSRVYKMARNVFISNCPICSPHKGCNVRKRKIDITWKNNRGNQWKE